MIASIRPAPFETAFGLLRSAGESRVREEPIVRWRRLERHGSIAAIALALAAAACAPVTVSRIGPGLKARGDKCAVEVLDRDEAPARPYRNVGLVAVESCEDYRTPPCRTWIEEAACELGGEIAYVDESERPDAPGASPMRAQVLVAVYVADLRPDPETDPVLRSRTCDPPCGAGKRCVNRECVEAAAPDCAGTELKPPPGAEAPAGPEKCLE